MGWLTGWTYRKQVTVTNASASYQTKILVGESSGATGEEVDCNSHCQTDFDDLRFTGADGTTLLDYWIESITDTTPNQLATIWVENNATPDTTLYMYYGKADATAVSSGANTFLLFDNFERGNNGDTVGGSWTEVAAHCHISTAVAYSTTRSQLLANSAAWSTIPYAAGTGYAIRNRAYINAFTNNEEVYVSLQGNGTNRITVLIDRAGTTLDGSVYYYDTDYRDTGVNITGAAAWQLFEINNIDWTAKTYDIWLNGVKIKAAAGMQTTTGSNGTIGVLSGGTANLPYFDDYIVRKWTATEPTWGSWGSEELMYIPTRGFYPHILAH